MVYKMTFCFSSIWDVSNWIFTIRGWWDAYVNLQGEMYNLVAFELCIVLKFLKSVVQKSIFVPVHIGGFNFWLLKYEFYFYTSGICFEEISATFRKKSHIRDRRVKSFRLVGYKSRFSFLLHIEGLILWLLKQDFHSYTSRGYFFQFS